MNLSRLFHCSVIKVLCFVAVQQLLYLNRCSSACQQFFCFSKTFSAFLCFSTAHLGYHIYHIMSITFLFFPTKFFTVNCRNPCRFSVSFFVELLHQRQLAYNSTHTVRSQLLFTVFYKERQFYKFTELSSFSQLI